MSGVNKVILLGRLGQEPKVTHTPAGNTVCNFSVATSESYKDKQGAKQERTEWHRVVCWMKLADLCGEYLKKGSQIYVEGSLQTRSWEGKDGQKRYTTEINAKTVTFLDSKPKQSGFDHDSPENIAIDKDAGGFTADDIPF